MTNKERQFLSHSNLIEGEFGDALPDSIEAWEKLKAIGVLTEGAILELHDILMRTRNLPDENKGVWTRHQTMIGRRLNPKPKIVPALMENWINMINWSVKGREWLDVDLDEFTKKCHIKFEHIHPFVDGNGRIGRLLYNWHRLRLGLPIKIIYYKNRREYYDWF